MNAELRRRCARMFMVGFSGLEPDRDFLSLVDEGVFGAVLFKRNVSTPEATAALCRGLKERAGRPFVLGVDQEGGRVARLRGSPFTALPPMREIGARGDPALAERVGRLLAYELRAVGFDWDFAPVLDVDTNPKNPVIGDRAFSRDPAVVAELGVALARGLEAGGVASSGKHFPGHGDTHQDSHHELPRLPYGIERLREVELIPFRAYAQAGLASLMTAHVIFEAVDADVPATMNPTVLRGILREELGFEGVLVSDDLEMKAIADHYGIERSAVAGALAGVDLFLVCHRADEQRRCIDALTRAVEEGVVPVERIEKANARLDILERRFAHPPENLLSRLGSADHAALSEGITAGCAGPDPTEVAAHACGRN